MADEYDVIVIGAGPGGEVLAGRCAESGLTTLVVESELIGGECSFWGCMPSKGLLRPGEVVAAAERVPGAREAVTGSLEPRAAIRRRNEIVGNWDDKYHVEWLEDRNVDIERGLGRIGGERAVHIQRADGSSRAVTARRAVVVATGSSPAIPPIEGLREIRTWDSRDVTSAQEAPGSLIVLGGGAVGVEMAQAWRSLGADRVVVIEAMDRLLPMEEPFAGAEIEASFTAQGIEVVTGARMMAAARAGDDGPVTATLEDGRGFVADELLVAVGRRPRTTDLGLETVGLEPGRFIMVDERLRATGIAGGWLYAIGDANGRALFTHMSKYHARCAAEDIIGSRRLGPAEHSALPRIVFTDPQVAAVGLTAAQARERGIDVGIARCDVYDVAGSTVSGENVTGPIQLVIDRDREVMVGATFIGPGVGDMLHGATIAIVGEVPLTRLRHAVPAFPSISEVWLKSIENYDASQEER